MLSLSSVCSSILKIPIYRIAVSMNCYPFLR